MIAVLRRRDFSLLWLSGLISVAGDWVLMSALPYFVYLETGSTLATAGMIVAELVPAVALTSFAGVFADRWNRVRVLVVTNLSQAAVVAALLLVEEGQLWVVYVVAAAQSSVGAFAGPAEAALLPSLVPRELLVQANAMNVINNRLGRLCGAPLGASLLTWAGLHAVVLVDVASFVIAGLLVLPITVPIVDHGDARLTETESARTRFWREWLAGLHVVRHDQTIGVLFLIFALMTFGGTMLDPLHVAWVRDVLDEGVGVLALLSITGSMAGIGGSLIIGALGNRVAARTLIGWSSSLAGAVLLFKLNVPSLWLAVVLTFVGGVLAVASAIGVETLAQEHVPDHLRGRVFGSLQATIWLASLLGAVVGGVLGSAWGLSPALNLAALLVGLSGFVALMAVPRKGSDEGAPTLVQTGPVLDVEG